MTDLKPTECKHEGALDVHLNPGATSVLDVEFYTCEGCGEGVEFEE